MLRRSRPSSGPPARALGVLGALAFALLWIPACDPGAVDPAGDGGADAGLVRRVCGWPVPSELQTQLVAAELCRCWEDLEYVSATACEDDLIESGQAFLRAIEDDPTACACLEDFVADYGGVVSDYQACVLEASDGLVVCSSRAACGTTRHAECSDAHGTEVLACLNRYFTDAAIGRLTACLP